MNTRFQERLLPAPCYVIGEKMSGLYFSRTCVCSAYFVRHYNYFTLTLFSRTRVPMIKMT
ncbi:hypothetical protein BDR04DRAFT_784772 [Suillus decipiens]|nr:hypothetical protein BDR04DRAFT_784772 [Suillus decipiens]